MGATTVGTARRRWLRFGVFRGWYSGRDGRANPEGSARRHEWPRSRSDERSARVEAAAPLTAAPPGLRATRATRSTPVRSDLARRWQSGYGGATDGADVP